MPATQPTAGRIETTSLPQFPADPLQPETAPKPGQRHLRQLVERPVDEQGPAPDKLSGQRPPETGIEGLVAVVAHHKEAVLGHHHRAEVVPHRVGLQQLPMFPFLLELGLGQGRVHHRHRKTVPVNGKFLVSFYAVDIKYLVSYLYRVTAPGNAALDQVDAVQRTFEDDNLPGPGRGQWQDGYLGEGYVQAVAEFFGDQPVAGQDGALHGAGGHLIGFQDERVDDKFDHQHRPDQGPQPVVPEFFEGVFFGH